MAKFTVCLQQYVEQTAEVVVEAETPEDAIDEAYSVADTAKWKPGDDAYDVDAYLVQNEADETVWER